MTTQEITQRFRELCGAKGIMLAHFDQEKRLKDSWRIPVEGEPLVVSRHGTPRNYDGRFLTGPHKMERCGACASLTPFHFLKQAQWFSSHQQIVLAGLATYCSACLIIDWVNEAPWPRTGLRQPAEGSSILPIFEHIGSIMQEAAQLKNVTRHPFR